METEKKGIPRRIDHTRKLPDKYSSPMLQDITRSEHYQKRNDDMKAVFYWMSCLIMIILNLMVVVILIPISFFFSGTELYILLAAIGIVIGTIFSQLILHTENLEQKQHIFAGLLLPVMAISNIYLITSGVYNIAKFADIAIENHPLITGICFSVFTLIPYIIIVLIKNRKKDTVKK